jgi:hypothetical protein
VELDFGGVEVAVGLHESPVMWAALGVLILALLNLMAAVLT